MPTKYRDKEWVRSVSARFARWVSRSGHSKTELAATLGVSPSRFSNWLSGAALIDPECAAELHRRFGVRIEWLYLGDESALGAHVRKQIHGN